jgi:hypothetical protein
METKNSKHGLNSAAIPSAGSTAAGVALFRKNGLNHPLTREPLARRELAAAEKKPKG